MVAYYGQIRFDDFTITGKSTLYLFSEIRYTRLYPNICIGFLHNVCIFVIISDLIVFFQWKAVAMEFLKVLYWYLQPNFFGCSSMVWLEERVAFRTVRVCSSKKFSINLFGGKSKKSNNLSVVPNGSTLISSYRIKWMRPRIIRKL